MKRGLLGRLPPDPAKRRLLIGAPTWVVEPPLPAVDHLAGVPLEMDGNDRKGNCVVVAAKNHFDATWLALCPGEAVPVVTEADCIRAYEIATGTTADPGPGLVTEQFLDWLLAHGLNSDPRTKPLAWGAIHPDWTSIEQVNSEFVAGIYGVDIHVAQEYPSKLWNDVGGADLGGHEVAGGKHDPNYIYAATWAYIAAMTRSYVANDLGEHHVIIWRHVWDNLTPERQAHLAADYQALTGRVFPVPPAPPVTPPRSAMNYTAIKPVRLLDTRSGNGLTGKFTAKVPRPFQITGRGGIPAGATAITGNLTVVGPTAGYAAYLDADPDPNPGTSTVNFGTGQVVGNGLTARLAVNGSVSLTYLASGGQTADFILDVTGYFS